MIKLVAHVVAHFTYQYTINPKMPMCFDFLSVFQIKYTLTKRDNLIAAI